MANAIREGAEGFLSTQYTAIFSYAAVTAVLLFLLYLSRPPAHHSLSTFGVALITSGTFATGAFMSGIAGYIGMWISVRANVRTAAAATRSYQEAIDTGMRGGAVCGLLVVGLCVFGITSLFVLMTVLFPELPVALVPDLLVGFSFGASLVALFAQLGGGIYTKAADVGADLVGKVEQNIPEDDPRNPAVIADLVGDNVGDCAGRGADLFESISAEIIGDMPPAKNPQLIHGTPPYPALHRERLHACPIASPNRLPQTALAPPPVPAHRHRHRHRHEHRRKPSYAYLLRQGRCCLAAPSPPRDG